VQPPTSAAGLRFEDALKDSGFLWPLMKVVDLIAAIGLLTNRAPAAALLLLLPIITVIILFHIVLNPQGMPVAILLALMTGTLLYAYRDRYAALLR
jgi:putative oxidoreductase